MRGVREPLTPSAARDRGVEQRPTSSLRPLQGNRGADGLFRPGASAQPAEHEEVRVAGGILRDFAGDLEAVATVEVRRLEAVGRERELGAAARLGFRLDGRK